VDEGTCHANCWRNCCVRTAWQLNWVLGGTWMRARVNLRELANREIVLLERAESMDGTIEEQF